MSNLENSERKIIDDALMCGMAVSCANTSVVAEML